VAVAAPVGPQVLRVEVQEQLLQAAPTVVEMRMRGPGPMERGPVHLVFGLDHHGPLVETVALEAADHMGITRGRVGADMEVAQPPTALPSVVVVAADQ